MKLSRIAALSALIGLVIFAGHSIPSFLYLRANQQHTSFPPSAAWFYGGYYAILAFAAAFVLLWIMSLLWKQFLRSRARVP